MLQVAPAMMVQECTSDRSLRMAMCKTVVGGSGRPTPSKQLLGQACVAIAIRATADVVQGGGLGADSGSWPFWLKPRTCFPPALPPLGKRYPFSSFVWGWPPTVPHYCHGASVHMDAYASRCLGSSGPRLGNATPGGADCTPHEQIVADKRHSLFAQ